jgi:hypothetical protein
MSDDRVQIRLAGLEAFEWVCALLRISGVEPLDGKPHSRQFSIGNDDLTPEGLAALLLLEGEDGVVMTGLSPSPEQMAEADTADIDADLSAT